MPANVFVIRAEHTLWHGLADGLASMPDVSVVGSSTDAEEARIQILDLRPEIVVSGLTVEGKSTVPILTAVRAALPEVSFVLVVTVGGS